VRPYSVAWRPMPIDESGTTVPIDPRPVVLIVDDEPTPRSDITRMVRGLGYQARSCRSGRDALRFLKAHPGEARLLLADLTMPKMDGGELAERALDLDRSLRVLLIVEPSDAETAELLAGYRDLPWVAKPVALDDLRKRLEELLRTMRPSAYPPSMGPPRVRTRRRSSEKREV
jgi:CheY-like chemotaxis protein